jgi:phospholipid/cholesterol/gamma-HCH transport system permease protein
LPLKSMTQTQPEENNWTVSAEGQKGEACTVFLSGEVALRNILQIHSRLLNITEEMKPKSMTVDLSAVRYLDSNGALILLKFRDSLEKRAIRTQFVRMTDDAARIFGLLDFRHPKTAAVPYPTSHPGFFIGVGITGRRMYAGFVLLMVFVGEVISSLIYSVRHPHSVRWDAVFFYMKRAGVDGLPIVGLISFLIGLIMAFMSSLQLRQFGANIYVASLVALAIVKELGPIMTAILVAGRSGSAFAAEIGTMMVNEEVDALTTMGFDSTRFLVIPKVLASVVVVPMLTVYADVIGVLGGLVVGVTGLDLTFSSYVKQTMSSIKVFDIGSSLVKSVCFALLISGIVCHRGFQVRGGAEAVGEAATSAVVSAIFLIIVCDSAFAIMLHYIRA